MKNCFIAFSVLFFLCCSCGQKMIPAATNSSCNTVQVYGSVALEDMVGSGNNNRYYLLENQILQNGKFRIQQDFTRSYRYWTSLGIEMPCTRQVNADDLMVEWKAKSELSVNSREADIGIVVEGSKDSAIVNCITEYRPPYTIFRIGNTKLTDVPELVIDPSKWSVYSVEIKNGTLKLNINGKLQKQLSTTESIGLLNTIFLHFKGTGQIEWVKVYESGKKILQSDFTGSKAMMNWAN